MVSVFPTISVEIHPDSWHGFSCFTRYHGHSCLSLFRLCDHDQVTDDDVDPLKLVAGSAKVLVSRSNDNVKTGFFNGWNNETLVHLVVRSRRKVYAPAFCRPGFFQ